MSFISRPRRTLPDTLQLYISYILDTLRRQLDLVDA
jgi:hypothetical protein